MRDCRRLAHIIGESRMAFSCLADIADIEQNGDWGSSNVPQTLYQMLCETTEKFPYNKASSFQILSGPTDKAETLTWQHLKDQVTQAANLFRDLGIGETDTIAYVLPNCHEALVTFLGGAVAGIVNPINPLLEAEQIASILRETKAKVVVTLKPFPKTDVAQKVIDAVRHAPGVTTVLEVDLLRYFSPPKSWIIPFIRPKVDQSMAHAKYMNFHTEIARQAKILAFTDTPQDRVACYFHTGGTTGMPKVAQHRYSGMIYNGWLGHELLFTEHDTILCPLPLFHVFACHVIVMSALRSGAHVVFPTPAGYRGEGVFDNLWKLCERWKVTFVVSVPTAMSMMIQRPVNADISTVRTLFSGSAPLPRELFRQFEDITNINVIEGYGLTEATCLVACNPLEGEKKLGSVGMRFPHCDVKTVKLTPDGPIACAAGEIGEICVSNPGVSPGNTYSETEKNAGLYFYGTHLRTGDLGYIDADGYIWITGRAKDLIIRGGHNIDPAEIEEALLQHPAVAFAGAIGQPDIHAGEVPCVYVELIDGADPSEEELLSYARANIRERAAVPKYLGILAELPKTAVGKVFKPDLRRAAITRIYTETLEQAGLSARVVAVVDDKQRGLTAQVALNKTPQTAVENVLGRFSYQWQVVADVQDT